MASADRPSGQKQRAGRPAAAGSLVLYFSKTAARSLELVRIRFNNPRLTARASQQRLLEKALERIIATTNNYQHCYSAGCRRVELIRGALNEPASRPESISDALPLARHQIEGFCTIYSIFIIYSRVDARSSAGKIPAGSLHAKIHSRLFISNLSRVRFLCFEF
jgi:hypothetical protein